IARLRPPASSRCANPSIKKPSIIGRIIGRSWDLCLTHWESTLQQTICPDFPIANIKINASAPGCRYKSVPSANIAKANFRKSRNSERRCFPDQRLISDGIHQAIQMLTKHPSPKDGLQQPVYGMMAPRGGVEPPTFPLGGGCSIQLSYRGPCSS